MSAVESLLLLFTLDERDGTITALDSYGDEVHIGTSLGHLLRLSIAGGHEGAAQQAGEATTSRAAEGNSTNDESAPRSPLPHPLAEPRTPDPRQSSSAPAQPSTRTTVSRRCTLSPTKAAVQQVEHSRSQRVLFVLCDARLLLLHAETYAVLSTIAVDAASFSVAQPVRNPLAAAPPKSGGGDAHMETPVRLPSGWSIATWEEGGGQHSRTSSEATHTNATSSLPRTPRNTLTPRSTTPATTHKGNDTVNGSAHRRSKPGRVHVVCVAEKHKKELAVYVVDRISTSLRKATGAAAAVGSSLSPSTVDLASAGSEAPRAEAQPVLSPSPPPRVVLRQRYVLPEPAQRVVMCAPAPIVVQPRRGSAGDTQASLSAADASTMTTAAAMVVEAGLTVCVGMRREVSLLPLLGGVPRCVLRLDGNRPPLLATGSDHNTYLVRTQAPNTVMEVGVPPSAAAAGLRRGGNDAQAEALVNPIVLRMCYQQLSAGAEGGLRSPFPSPCPLQRGRDDELIMGDVFQSDAPVELVLTRFPFVLLFTATHCDVVSLLGNGGSGGGGGGTSPSSSTLQRVPVAGIRHGALRGHGTAIFVASDRSVWSLQLFPLRAQLAAMVQTGHSEEAFQLLAFHQQRAMALEEGSGGSASSIHVAPLAVLERDLHRMVGFARLFRGDIGPAIRSFRSHLDPRELLLCLPDCVPPHAMSLVPPPSKPPASSYPTATDGIGREEKVTARPEVTSKPHREGHVVLHGADTNLSAAEVRFFLFGDAAKHTCEERRGGGDGTCTAAAAVAAHASYWEEWDGPCVYNSSPGEVERAWRASFDAAAAASALTGTTATSVDCFVSQCYATLKDEVRRWFAEELALAESTASAAPVRGDASSFSTQMDGVVVHSSSLALLSAPFLNNIHRRAMAYASLVLAWQARDFRAAYRVVSSASSNGLRVSDCEDVLCCLGEHRLLALLCFQAGDGERCAELLRRHACLPRVLRLSDATLLSLEQASYVQTQLVLWRQCMEKKFQLSSNALTARSLNGGCASEDASVPCLRSDAVVCGLGLLRQPSAAHARRVASLLFGLPEENGVQLLDAITNFYTAETSGLRGSRGGGGFIRLRFCSAEGGDASSTDFTLPHAGPLMAPLPPSQGDVVTRGDRPSVLPSSLTEYLYAVEKLDLCTLRHLLLKEPRWAQVRGLDGSTGLHVALAQVRTAVPLQSSVSVLSMQARGRRAEERAAALRVVCAVVQLLVHCGCPAAALTCTGWSCLDVAAVACGEDDAALDLLSAALVASLQLAQAETRGH